MGRSVREIDHAEWNGVIRRYDMGDNVTATAGLPPAVK